MKRATKAESKSRRDVEVRKTLVEGSPFLHDSSVLFVLSDKGITDFITDLLKEIDKPLTVDSDKISSLKIYGRIYS